MKLILVVVVRLLENYSFKYGVGGCGQVFKINEFLFMF